MDICDVRHHINKRRRNCQYVDGPSVTGTQAERSAIERVQSTLKQSKAAIEVELEMKG